MAPSDFALAVAAVTFLDQRVRQPGSGDAGRGSLHDAAAGALADADHRVGEARPDLHILQLPVEQLAVK